MQDDNQKLPDNVLDAYEDQEQGSAQIEPMTQPSTYNQDQTPQEVQEQPLVAAPNEPIYTGLSGNELFCLNQIGYKPGNLVVGNSVYAIGVIGAQLAGIRTVLGGEVKQVTNMIANGRVEAINRLEKEISANGGNGATGVTSELIFHQDNIEFLSIGSTIHRTDGQPTPGITSSSDGQEFFCQVDSGYIPIKFVFGNVAYSIGIGKSIMGELKELVKGEVTQYSDVFNTTRNLALERIVDEAKKSGANSVVGIRTTIVPFGQKGVKEMVMVGTASYNEQIAQLAEANGGVLTSDLTAEETWNITKMGYAPVKLILGTSIFSLGVMGGIKAALRSLAKGEVNTLTELIYQAREQSFNRVKEQAKEVGADDVLGIKTYIYQLDNNLTEFLTIGTATKKMQGLSTRSDQILPQAIIRDKQTFVDLSAAANAHASSDLNNSDISQNNPNTV
ncbi:MAG: heavy metal-binding domain-containing protein [Candidatus Saccharibacteria bacterium]